MSCLISVSALLEERLKIQERELRRERRLEAREERRRRAREESGSAIDTEPEKEGNEEAPPENNVEEIKGNGDDNSAADGVDGDREQSALDEVHEEAAEVDESLAQVHDVDTSSLSEDVRDDFEPGAEDQNNLPQVHDTDRSSLSENGPEDFDQSSEGEDEFSEPQPDIGEHSAEAAVRQNDVDEAGEGEEHLVQSSAIENNATPSEMFDDEDQQPDVIAAAVKQPVEVAQDVKTAYENEKDGSKSETSVTQMNAKSDAEQERRLAHEEQPQNALIHQVGAAFYHTDHTVVPTDEPSARVQDGTPDGVQFSCYGSKILNVMPVYQHRRYATYFLFKYLPFSVSNPWARC
ncbi:hypothetical protein QAD02_003052 [Eretmocerus hayati]|uniref:Uncharacterized protein n=1 Tax=Eretmocerus hayati TaxID=131215 RepID=A0ACC2NLW1_9HYME|nr:hypothetical protein QAD02_003052 [Eretmocerus hayati]